MTDLPHTKTPLRWANIPHEGNLGEGNLRLIGAVFTEEDGCTPHMIAVMDEMKRRWFAHRQLMDALETAADYYKRGGDLEALQKVIDAALAEGRK